MPELLLGAVTLSALALAGASSYLAHRAHERQRSEWVAEKRDLLNRVMSGDYREYRAGETPRRNSVRVLTDADEKRISERAS